MSKKKEIVYEIAMGRVPGGWEKDPTRIGWKKGKQFVGALEVEKEIGNHTCAICGDGPDPDIRYLRIGCFYDLNEVSDKFEKIDNLYVLPFCKACRGHFMFEVLGKWVNSNPSQIQEVQND